MDLGVSGPLSERLSKKPENNTRKTPKEDQTHVCHNRRDVTTLDDPRCNELRKAVSPDVLVDRDSDED